MLENLFKKVPQSIAKKGLKPFWWLRIFPPGVWIVITVVGLVGGRWWWVTASRPAHLQEITLAFGSAGQFYGVPQMSHNGRLVTYVATDDHGYSLFLRDTDTGERHVMAGQNGLGEWGDSLDMVPGPWVPDDSAFLYSANGQWILCPVDTNFPPVTLGLGGNVAISSIIWLNPQEFAWQDGQTISYAQKSADGRWSIHALPHQGRISSLTAVDTHTLAWLEENYICRLDLVAYLAGTNNPFTPLSADAYTAPLTNNLMLWLDASTLQQPDQSPVTGLTDSSRCQNAAIVDQNPPTFNASNSPSALNFKGTIHFTSGRAIGDANGLKTVKRLGIGGSHPRSIFAVLRRDTGRSKMLINLGNTLTNGSYFGVCDQNDYLYLPSGAFTGKNDGRLNPLPPSWHILETIYDGTNANGYANGGFLGAAAFSYKTANVEVEIGLRPGNSPGQTNAVASDGDFAELLIYDRALNLAEQLEVEDYLSAKWFGNRRPVSAKNAFVWLDPQMKGLTGFKYSRELGRFLISRNENGHDTWWRLDAKEGGSTNATLMAQDRDLQNVQLIGTGEFDYISREAGHPGLMLADSTGNQNTRLFGHEDIPWFQVTPDEKKMLFIGTVSNCPSVGIWQYDFGSKQVRSVAPWSEHPSTYAKILRPFGGDIRLPSGRSVHCTIFPPANFDRHKKYPLLLGNTVVDVEVMGAPILKAAVRAAHGRLWAQCLATGGAFVVIINRPAWMDGIDQWEENIRGVYQSLMREPCIDANHVYLFAASAETPYLSECLAKSPGLWKGAIYLSPTALPDFSKSPAFQARPRTLISIGSKENQEEHIRHNLTNNLDYGVIEEMIIHPGEAHRVFGNAAQFARTAAMIHFIFEE